jgi:ADP-heptose:LPS heptosyltransferase
MPEVKKIIISRTDSIGDVILTLPVAGILKQLLPKCKIIFLGKAYTRDIVEACRNIDQFIDWNSLLVKNQANKIEFIKSLNAEAIIHVFPVKEIAEIAKLAKIPLRIGSTGRYYHYTTCNKLVPMSRKRSHLHEAQLNLKLIRPLGGERNYSIISLQDNYGFENQNPLSEEIKQMLKRDKFNLILHPKSKGSAREWGINNFSRLIEILPRDKFRIFITGTKDEGEFLKKDLINIFPEIIDLTGRLSLKELISFIDNSDGLIAASTGPLHIAAALGKYTLGLYPPIKPMHPGRWAPIGKKAEYLVLEKNCSKCRKESQCACLQNISPEIVKNKLLSWLND